LTCLNAQTTCPSGVEYGICGIIGRKIVDARVRARRRNRNLRWLLKEGLITSPLFAPAMRLGQAVLAVAAGRPRNNGAARTA